ncbi:MAG: 4'-phosphopantetheinyl transferase superfamily protein, partial [Planctomycetota bacterium]|nr:4'-phosphopantetheinyl transferase superfamily protein [Planctomycetota bacterium]
DATYVAAVLAREPVGVDLERVAERRAALHDKVADETERELLAPWDALAFTRLWTAKESVLKAAGVGMAELSGCRLRGREGDALTLEHRGRACHVLQRQFGDHVFAVHLTGRTPTVRWDLP